MSVTAPTSKLEQEEYTFYNLKGEIVAIVMAQSLGNAQNDMINAAYIAGIPLEWIGLAGSSKNSINGAVSPVLKAKR